jgi:hypothetical protein
LGPRFMFYIVLLYHTHRIMTHSIKHLTVPLLQSRSSGCRMLYGSDQITYLNGETTVPHEHDNTRSLCMLSLLIEQLAKKPILLHLWPKKMCRIIET